jgi:hypothetical protein
VVGLHDSCELVSLKFSVADVVELVASLDRGSAYLNGLLREYSKYPTGARFSWGMLCCAKRDPI